MVIKYIGDESVAAQFPHGNSKAVTRNYVRTQPHVIRQAESTDRSARQTYQQLVEAAPTDSQTTGAPRNLRQVQNAMHSARSRVRVSRDALYNLHEIALDTGFIHHITSFPDLLVVMYAEETMAMFIDQVRAHRDVTHVLSYDTTFTLGDFYLSALMFRPSEFDPSPIMPLAYLLHERKTTNTHRHFWELIADVCKPLSSARNVVVVTDQEQSVIAAIDAAVPNLRRFVCRNHVLQDCKRWLRSHGVNGATELTYYVDSVKDLLSRSTEKAYTERLLDLSTEVNCRDILLHNITNSNSSM